MGYSCSSLVSRANKWLRENGQVRVKVCESIEVKGRYDGVVDTNKSSYFEGDHIKKKMRNMYIRALRYNTVFIQEKDATFECLERTLKERCLE